MSLSKWMTDQGLGQITKIQRLLRATKWQEIVASPDRVRPVGGGGYMTHKGEERWLSCEYHGHNMWVITKFYRKWKDGNFQKETVEISSTRNDKRWLRICATVRTMKLSATAHNILIAPMEMAGRPYKD